MLTYKSIGKDTVLSHRKGKLLTAIILDNLKRVTHFCTRQQEKLFAEHINQRNSFETRKELGFQVDWIIWNAGTRSLQSCSNGYSDIIMEESRWTLSDVVFRVHRWTKNSESKHILLSKKKRWKTEKFLTNVELFIEKRQCCRYHR